MEHHVDHTQKRFLIGFVILAAGMALLLKNFGILDYQITRYLWRWEVILIALGIVFILSHDNKGPGIILIFIGGAFYLSDFFDFHFNFWQLFLPALLILAGILILFRHRIDYSDSEKKNLDNEDIIDELNL